MKRFFAILLTLTVLFALIGCQASAPVTQDPATAQTETPATDATSQTPQEPAQILPTPETVNPTEQADENDSWDDLTNAYDLVETGFAYEGENYSYYLPTLKADTAGAKAINDAIYAEFGQRAEESARVIEANTEPYTIVTDLCSVNWYLTVYDGVISLVVSATNEGDWTEYKVYYYDMAEGTALTKAAMLDRLDLAEDELLEGTRNAVRERFETQYGDLPEETREQIGYYDCLALADSDEIINMDMLEFAVDEGAFITVFAPVPSIAGAGYYYQALYPTLAMG